MGGKGSKEKSKWRTNGRKSRDNFQSSREQGVLPVESVSLNVNSIDTTYMSRQTSFTSPSILEGHGDLEDISQNFDFVRDSYFRNDNCFNQLDWESISHFDDVGRFNLISEDINCLNFNDNRYKERQFRTVRRHHSFNENRFQLKNDDDVNRDYRSIRCNSMVDLCGRGFPFEGQYIKHGFTDYSNHDLPNCTLRRRNSNASDRCDGQVKMGCGGIKRSTLGDCDEDLSRGDSSRDLWEDNNYVLDSPGKPRVKRRQLGNRQSLKGFSDEYNYRNENELCNSGLLFYSSTSTSSNSVDSKAPDMSKVIGHNLLDKNSGALDILSFPSEWSSFAVDKTGYVNIPLSSPEGKCIEKFFNRTNKSCMFITGIVRIENPFLHTLYLLRKEEMAVKYGHVDELFLYHGTKKRFVTKICENNLDWRQYSDMHRFGKGVSFSPSAMYSSHYSDDKTNSRILILFKVLVSNCVQGSSEMEIPQNEEGNFYDTSIKEDASVIVKYNDSEFYPLYKIIYKKK